MAMVSKQIYTFFQHSQMFINFRFVGAVSDLLPWAAASPEGRSLCNHRRAYKFFTDSVSPKCHFPAFPCSDYDTFLEVSSLTSNSKASFNFRILEWLLYHTFFYQIFSRANFLISILYRIRD